VFDAGGRTAASNLRLWPALLVLALLLDLAELILRKWRGLAETLRGNLTARPQGPVVAEQPRAEDVWKTVEI
jgi:hypothetical protein